MDGERERERERESHTDWQTIDRQIDGPIDRIE